MSMHSWYCKHLQCQAELCLFTHSCAGRYGMQILDGRQTSTRSCLSRKGCSKLTCPSTTPCAQQPCRTITHALSDCRMEALSSHLEGRQLMTQPQQLNLATLSCPAMSGGLSTCVSALQLLRRRLLRAWKLMQKVL